MDFFDFGDFGDGFFDDFLGLGELFDGLFGSSEFESVLSAAARGGFEEAGLGRLFGLFADAGDVYVDWMLYSHFKGNNQQFHGFKEQWEKNVGEETKHVIEVVKGHGFMLSQLKAHKDKASVAPLLNDYARLGAHLPEEGVVTQVYKKLSMFLHPDQNGGADEMFKQLGAAKEALMDPAKRAEYQKALRDRPEEIRSMFSKASEFGWKDMYDTIKHKSRLMLESSTFTGARRWVEDLNSINKGALVFSVIAGVGACAYLGAKWFDESRSKKQKDSMPKNQAWVDRSKEYNNFQQTSAGIA